MKENFEQAWQKFKDFVLEYMQNLQGQKSQLDKAMESEKIISSLSKEKSLKAVLEARDVLTFLDPSLKLDIEMLAFFEANQAILLPQVTEILEKILSSPIILNYAENTLENQKKLQMIKANIKISKIK